MSNLIKKIVAIVTTITCAVWLMGPSVAQGITAAELQAQIDALLAQLATLQAQLTELQETTPTVTGCTITSFDRSLKQGMSGDDVKCLQITLNSSTDTQVAASGNGSPGQETTYFGPLTKAAVVKFQEKYAADVLTPLGLTSGTGFVGTKTLVKLNSLLGVVPTGCDCTTWLDGVCGAGTCTDSQRQQTRTCTPAACAAETQCVADATCAAVGENKVQLAADTSAAATVAKGAIDVIFAKINFCAASEANTISKIVVTRGGIAADTDVSYIKLYDGITQIGATQALNSTTHKASFSSLSWVIAANSCKVLTIKASIAAAATQGNTVKFGINEATDITSTVALSGTFPILSNGMTIAGISVGPFLAEAQTTPSGSVIAGGTEQAVAAFKFTASSTEGIKVHSITFREVGTSVDADIANIKLFYGSTQIGSTVAALSNGLATFDLSSSPLEVLAGASKILTVYVDLGTSTGVADRTVRFEITNYNDVVAYGTNSGGAVNPYGGTSWLSTSSSFPQQGQSIDITLGGLTIAQDTSYSPSAQTYVVGTTQDNMVAFRFTAGAYEAIRITQIKLNATGTGAGSDSNVSNVTLYDVDGNVVSGPAGMVSGVVTFGSYTTGLDATGLFDIAKSSYKTIIVKADIPTGASSSATIGFEIRTPNSNVKADGLTSQNDLATTDINPSTTLPSTGIKHTIGNYGSLTVSLNSGSPSAATYALGVVDYTFAKFDLTSVGEDIIVSQLNVTFATDTAAVAKIIATGDVQNIKIYDGSTLLKTDSAISSGKAEFGINLTVPKNTTKTLTVVGDIPTGSTAPYFAAAVDVSTSNVVATGKDSGLTLTAAPNGTAVFGSLMTKGVPTVTVKPSTTPVSQTYILGTSGAHIGTFLFTADPAEDLKITRIKIAADASTTNATSSFANSTSSGEADLTMTTYVSNAKLYDGSAQIGSTVPTLLSATNYYYADFTGLSLSISKGTTKAIDVKLDTLAATATPVFVGFTASTDVAGTGLSSGQAVTVTMEGGGIASQVMTLGSAGTLAVQVDLNTPDTVQILSGASGVEFSKWKFAASNESIKISKLVFNATTSAAATGSSVGVGAISTSSPNTWLATDTAGFYYSLNDGLSMAAATMTCLIATTTVLSVPGEIAKEIALDCPDLLASVSASGVLTLWASTTKYSLEISPFGASASNCADNLGLGLKYNGTENIGTYAGSNNNIVKVGLYGTGLSYTPEAYIGAEAGNPNQVVFNFPSGSEILIDRLLPKVLTLKADMSNYLGAVEGSYMKFGLGASAVDYVTNYITAKGGSSGTTLTTGSIINDSAATSGALNGNPMYIYTTKPTVAKVGPVSGTGSPTTNEEVLRFTVAAASGVFDLNINAIQFKLSSNSTTAAATLDDGAWYLYKYVGGTETLIAESTPYVPTNQAYGYVAMYPSAAGGAVGAGSTNTYILRGYTAGMNIGGTTSETLTVSIESNKFYWDDYYSSTAGAVNGNVYVSGLPITGGSLSY